MIQFTNIHFIMLLVSVLGLKHSISNINIKPPNIVGEWKGKYIDNEFGENGLTIKISSENNNTVKGVLNWDNLIFIDTSNHFTGKIDNKELIFKISSEDFGFLRIKGQYNLKLLPTKIFGTVRSGSGEIIAQIELLKND